MENLTAKDFDTWAANNHWLKIGEGKSNEGFPQENYLTPSGGVDFVIFDNDRTCVRTVTIAMLMPMMPPMPGRFPGINFRGGQHLHP